MIPEASSDNVISVDDCPSQPPWLLPEALQYLAEEGDYESVRAILTAFRTDTTARLNLLCEAVAKADVPSIRRQAHAISGSARLVDADAIVSLCVKIEVEAAELSAGELGKLSGSIRAHFEDICRAIGEESGQPPPVGPDRTG